MNEMNLDDMLEMYDNDREVIDRYFASTVVSLSDDSMEGQSVPFFCQGTYRTDDEFYMEGVILSAASNRSQRAPLSSLRPYYPGPRMVNSRGNGFYVHTNVGGGSWRRSVLPNSMRVVSLVPQDTLMILRDAGARAVSNYPRGNTFRSIIPQVDTAAWHSEVWSYLWGNKDYPTPHTGYEAIMEGRSVSCAVSPTEALVMGDAKHDVYINHRGYLVGWYDGDKAYLDLRAKDLVEQISMWTDTEVAA